MVYQELPEDFDENGLLRVGTYEVDFPALRGSLLVHGPANDRPEPWDAEWRAHLVDNAEVLVTQLWSAGITEVFLDGSFVEAKPHPHDIDGYFECDVRQIASGELPRTLNASDPHGIWTWHPRSRRPAPGSTKKQLPMWHTYRVELYPHYPGLLSGITDQHGNALQFPAAFRLQRGTGYRKGIVKVVSKA